MLTTMVANRSVQLSITCVLMWSVSASGVPILFNLGILPGTAASYGRAVNVDGSVAVGRCDLNGKAFRWTETTGIEDIGTLGGTWAEAFCVSNDGAVVAGASGSPDGDRAFIWIQGFGMVNLGVLSGDGASYGQGVSADGTIVVGSSDGRAFRWTSVDGMQEIAPNGIAYGISADGTAIVGENGDRAFRWTNTGGLENLGTLPGGGVSAAEDASDDGSAVTGHAHLGIRRAFRWTESGGMEDLGIPPGATALHGQAISGDGSVVVGDYQIASDSYAFIWTSELGIIDLNRYLIACGVDLSGWILTDANDISSNASAITGNGIFNGEVRAWLVTGVVSPCAGDTNWDGAIDLADLNAVLFAFGGVGPMGDVDYDGDVDLSDLNLVLFHFGTSC